MLDPNLDLVTKGDSPDPPLPPPRDRLVTGESDIFRSMSIVEVNKSILEY